MQQNLTSTITACVFVLLTLSSYFSNLLKNIKFYIET